MAANHRSEPRKAVRIAASLREAGAGRFQVYVRDLSGGGFRMESLTTVNLDRIVYLTLPGMTPLRARIAWRDRELYGCEFIHPLHIAVLDHIVARFPELV